jgi:hypothetical protein
MAGAGTFGREWSVVPVGQHSFRAARTASNARDPATGLVRSQISKRRSRRSERDGQRNNQRTEFSLENSSPSKFFGFLPGSNLVRSYADKLLGRVEISRKGAKQRKTEGAKSSSTLPAFCIKIENDKWKMTYGKWCLDREQQISS